MNGKALAIVGIAATALFFTSSAQAAFPGKNGKIVFGTLHAGEDEIWVMKADGTDRRNLTRHDGKKVTDIDPRWSPDGRRIVFASDRGGTMQIWSMDDDGSNPRQVTGLPGRNRLPSWTADGQQIVFQHLDAGSFEIYRVNADGTGVANLTNNPAVDWSPATSAQGKKIVFTSERDGNGHLYVLTPDGELQRITNGARYDYFANWAPRGNDIVFIREDAAGENDIYLVHSDGSGERRLTNTPGRTEYFPAFSPDGDKVAYTACSGFPVPWAPKCSTQVLDIASGTVHDLAFPDLVLPNPYFDGFDDGVRDVNVWQLLHDGVGGFFAETNGRMEMTIDGPQAPGETIASRVDFHCLLTGDFDAQVDYTLLTWPTANGVAVQIHAFLDDATVSRQSQAWGESYSAWSPFGSASVPAMASAGSLRLARSGGMMTSYYRENGEWAVLQATPAGGGTALVTLEAASYGTFGGQPVRVAFDNFTINAAGRDCSSWRPDWHPDWQAVR